MPVAACLNGIGPGRSTTALSQYDRYLPSLDSYRLPSSCWSGALKRLVGSCGLVVVVERTPVESADTMTTPYQPMLVWSAPQYQQRRSVDLLDGKPLQLADSSLVLGVDRTWGVGTRLAVSTLESGGPRLASWRHPAYQPHPTAPHHTTTIGKQWPTRYWGAR